MTSDEALAFIASSRLEDRLSAVLALKEYPVEARLRLSAMVLDTALPPTQRAWCAMGLAQVGDDATGAVSKVLCKCLDSPIPLIRYAATTALGDLGSESAIDDIARLVSDHEAVPEAWSDDACYPAQAAIEALERIGTPAALERIPRLKNPWQS